MSLVQPSVPERRPSPALSLNLSSNNPFRNRAASPQGLPSPSPSLPTPRTTAQRPHSRNPFLAEFEAPAPQTQFQTQFPPYQPNNMATPSDKPNYASAAEELFAEMSLQDKDDKKAGPNGASFPRPPGPSRSGTAPGRPPRPDDDHRRNASGSRAPPRRPPPREELDIFKSPGRSENRRPRRNSESSIMDKTSMEDERRRRERRHRERKERESGRTRDKDGKVRKPRGLDLIDKLDVSGIYGPSMFHHDGPFDACNPHRNRKRDQRAPMQAFPEGSANNVMGGSGPVNQSMNLDQFHGRGAEGFSDFSSAARNDEPLPKPSAAQTGFYNPKAEIEAIHGDESNGLGTSTFLEGAPASRKDLERRGSENDGLGSMGGGGLARKKSLAQRIRGISQPRRDYGGRVVSPDAQYEFRRPPPPPPNGQSSPMSAGGRGKMQEKNPFFDEYDDSYEKKGASIRISEQQRPGRARAPSSPGRPNLERLPTGEAGPADEPKPSGFLTRMKSLKGGPRKPKPERRPS